MRKLILTEVPNTDDLIFENREFNVIVLGLPRTGTSMMSGILERLGVKWIKTTDTEEEKEKRRKNELARFGETYKMNEEFYEIHKEYFNNMIRCLATDYSGMKMILPLRQHQLQVLEFRPFRVIQMYRDPEEIRQSQQASYRKNEVQTEEEALLEVERYRNILVDTTMLLEQYKIPVQTYQYRDVLNSPEEKVKKIAAFINSPNSINEAVSWIDPNKNRFKKEKLTIGI